MVMPKWTSRLSEVLQLHSREEPVYFNKLLLCSSQQSCIGVMMMSDLMRHRFTTSSLHFKFANIINCTYLEKI